MGRGNPRLRAVQQAEDERRQVEHEAARWQREADGLAARLAAAEEVHRAVSPTPTPTPTATPPATRTPTLTASIATHIQGLTVLQGLRFFGVRQNLKSNFHRTKLAQCAPSGTPTPIATRPATIHSQYHQHAYPRRLRGGGGVSE